MVLFWYVLCISMVCFWRFFWRISLTYNLLTYNPLTVASFRIDRRVLTLVLVILLKVSWFPKDFLIFLNSSKKRTKNLYPSRLGKNFQIRFLEELKTLKFPFQINWPFRDHLWNTYSDVSIKNIDILPNWPKNSILNRVKRVSRKSGWVFQKMEILPILIY